MTVHRLVGFPLAAIIFLVTAGAVPAQTQKELLDELDRTIEEAESYVAAKEVRIKTIENSLHSRGVSPERQYKIYGELFDEYQPFNYGKAVENLEKQKEIAMLLGDKSKLNNVYLKEANAAKEEYIGLFLSMCSNYIDKMKAYQSGVRKLALAGNLDKLIADTSSPDNVEKELKEFYEMFDKAFLKLYPKFVEQFNGLLREDARIELKKGKLLNTELRIFALIRLGITQSSDIASMLRYSVNTIYNYRAQIKNSALGDRDNFEERIKEIGN